MVINSIENEKQERRTKRQKRWCFSQVCENLSGQRRRRCGKNTCGVYRYIKGLLCVCVTIYFFIFGPEILTLLSSSSSSSSSSDDSYASLHPLQTTVSSASFFSRAVEEANILTKQPKKKLLLPSGGGEDVNGLKVFVYDLPSRFNNGWLSNERCSKHLFAAEVAIHRALMGSSFRTLRPEEADFFFVPIYASCNFSTVNGFPAIGHARKLFASAVELVSQTLPFWNRSNGADHIFVATHDFGACFHTMEDAAKRDGIPAFMKQSIILQTFGVNEPHPCQSAAITVQIPPYVSPEAIQKALTERKGRRDIWVFFRGKLEIHPKNINGQTYSKGVRTTIWKRYSGNKRFYIKREKDAGYLGEIARSVFCLCPLGWAPWSPRIVESAALGCIPVVIADRIRLPFQESVSWPEISLTIPERDVPRLHRILSHVSATNLSAIQRNLRRPSVRQALLFHDPVRPGDATWQVFRSLARHGINKTAMLSSS